MNHVIEEEESINDIIKTFPNVLDNSDLDVKKAGNYFLPFKTGFEIECAKQEHFDINDFKNINNIIDVNVDSSEQRFQIPNGILGLQCLYNISLQLKLNSYLNDKSGIHYHVDFTDCFDLFTDEQIKSNKEWILNELDSWNYKGTYNERNIVKGKFNWVGIRNKFKTLEFRIGEMTFDYNLLFQRIHHCNMIVKKLKTILIDKELSNNNLITEEMKLVKINNTLENRIIKI